MTTGGMMFRNHRLRKVLLCLGLEVAALMGAPMRPDEIEDLLRNSRQARIDFIVRRFRCDYRGSLLPAERTRHSAARLAFIRRVGNSAELDSQISVCAGRCFRHPARESPSS